MRLRCVMLAASMAIAAGCDAQTKWEPIGLSGGGGMFLPGISPVDPNLMLLNCDMSAAYLSTDGGKTWRMLHYSQLRSNTRCRPAFHPTDANVIYAANGWGGVRVSRDRGVTWQPIGDIKGAPVGEIAIDPVRPDNMLVGTDNGVRRSADAGKNWTPCDGISGEPMAFYFDRSGPQDHRARFAATAKGIWRSDDGGVTWVRKSDGLPEGRDLLSFAGGSTQRECVLYCTVPSVLTDGKLTGGIFRSTDRGDTWVSSMGAGLNVETKAFDEWAMGPIAQYPRVATCDANPHVVYACNTNTGVPPPHHASVYRSDDTGATWRPTFQGDPRFPDCNVEEDYGVVGDGQYYQNIPELAVCGGNPDRVLRVDTSVYTTVDSGKTWQCAHTHPADPPPLTPATAWTCNGLVITTTWNYYIDPFRPQRHYICYTDLGFAFSDDRGKTWRWWPLKGRAPWNNTCYQLAFDPATPGKVWGAFSNTHDIPNDNIISGRHGSNYPGGVCVSDDFATTWRVSNQGLPLRAVTCVVVDPKSPKGRRTLYAGVFGGGVFKSTDDGKTWVAKNVGLGSDSNKRVCRIALHPDGTLFALVTALRQNGRFVPEGVGLYRSTDGGERWTPINRSQPLLWPKDFTIDPRSSRTIYVGAADAREEKQGGLYRTTDGGATWTRLCRKGPEHFGAYLNPKHPGWIYATLTEGAPGAGLWLSKDNGGTWKAMSGLPFGNAQRVAFDPSDPETIYVTTFGGSVWKGPASE